MDWSSVAESPLGEGTTNLFPMPAPTAAPMRSTQSLRSLDHFRSEYTRPSDTDASGRA